jgi:uncharacterized protein YbjT (DUF2867 family)
MFAVAGVTGRTGAVVAATLLERKQPVRVIVRSAAKGDVWKAQGAEVAVASLADAPALAKALDGVTGAYLLLPSNDQAVRYVEDRQRVATAIASAVELSRLPHVVFLSSIGAHLTTDTGPIRALHYAEVVLAPVAQSLTIVRAPYFMENWALVLDVARRQGVLPSFLSPNRKIPMIATRDIGHIAAECLLDRPKGRRILELSGPQDYSPLDVAAAVGRALHRDVKVQSLPLSAAVPTLVSAGLSDDVAHLFEELYAGLESGRITYEGNGACRPRGLVTLSEVVSSWTPAPAERSAGDPVR